MKDPPLPKPLPKLLAAGEPGTGLARGGECRVPPVHDPAYFDDLAGRLYGLMIIISDRLPADQAEWLHHVVEVGEYDLALGDLVGMLAYDKITITNQERGDIAALARQMKMDLGPSFLTLKTQT
jgi:hypothetical protein